MRKDTSLCPSMSVEHTLRFHAALRRPRQNQHQVKMDDRDRVSKGSTLNSLFFRFDAILTYEKLMDVSANFMKHLKHYLSDSENFTSFEYLKIQFL